MSRPDVWMPLYIGEYLADTMRLTTIQHGAYLLLLMEYWKSGPLPDDEDELAAIVKMEPRSWAKISTSIRRFFHIGKDGLLHQRRADTERDKAADISAKRRNAAMQRTDRKPAAAGQTGGGEGGSGPQKVVQLQPHLQEQVQEQEHQQPPPQLDTHTRGLPPSPSKEDSVPSGTDAEPASPPPSARDLLWSQGVPLLHHLTGKSDGQCRGMLGRMLRDLQDDCPRLLLVLQQANQARPIDPVAWLTAATRPKNRPDRDEKILRAAGLWRDDAGPIVEHEEPVGMLGLPSPMRWHQ